MNQVVGLIVLAIVGVCVADIVTHASAVTKIGDGFNSALTTAFTSAIPTS